MRLSPRHALVTNTFLAYAAFLLLLVMPVSAYFYVFHGDWFLHYVVDVRRVPSAVALFGFAVEGAIGTAGFLVGAGLARAQRDGLGATVVAVCLLAAMGVYFVLPERLLVVGTYAQFRGRFGLTEYGGALLRGGVAMASYLLLGAVFLLFRIRHGLRRARQ